MGLWGQLAGQLAGPLAGAAMSAFSSRKAENIAGENRDWQSAENTKAYERSRPWSSYGPAGDVEFDLETKKIMQTLAPEYQNLMNQYLGTADKSTAELLDIMGDPYAMEQQQFKRFEDLNKNAFAMSRAQGTESAIARGMAGGTEGYYDRLAIEDAIGKERMRGQLAAMQTGMDYRKMLGAESLAQGEGAMNVVGMLRDDGTLGMNVPKHIQVASNMQGIRQGGQDYADTKSAFWSNMLDQSALYNNSGQLMREGKKGYGSSIFDAIKGSDIGKKFFSSIA